MATFAAGAKGRMRMKKAVLLFFFSFLVPPQLVPDAMISLSAFGLMICASHWIK
jgi:hypothetical protein